MPQHPDPTSPSDVPGWVRPERPDPSSTQPIVQTPTAAQPSVAGPVDIQRPVADDVATATAPAVRPPTWSGRKTAVAAALAVGLGVIGAVGASAAVVQDESVGSDTGPPGGGVPGRGQGVGGGTGPAPRGGTGQLPWGGTGQLPGGTGDPSATDGLVGTI